MATTKPGCSIVYPVVITNTPIAWSIPLVQSGRAHFLRASGNLRKVYVAAKKASIPFPARFLPGIPPPKWSRFPVVTP